MNMARSVKLHHGCDNQVRSIDLLVFDHEKQRLRIFANQSVQNVALLESDLTIYSTDHPIPKKLHENDVVH